MSPGATELRVLVVDDSAVMRRLTVATLGAVDGLVVETAADGTIARRKIARRRPDVVLLDVEMPGESGLSLLREVMATDPLPVVIHSAYAKRGTRVAVEALSLGAVDVVAKPAAGGRDSFLEGIPRLVEILRQAAVARVLAIGSTETQLPERGGVAPARGRRRWRTVGIGASTGGPQALRRIVRGLPAESPPIVVVQHMPERFTRALAQRLDREAIPEVAEASQDEEVVPGRILIAPGGRHLEVVRVAGCLRVRLHDRPPVAHHRPSVDVLLSSLARSAGAETVGVLLTGMGSDGVAGLSEIRQAGGRTLVQDEETSVVYGMPRQAMLRGVAERELPLDELAAALLDAAALVGKRTRAVMQEIKDLL